MNIVFFTKNGILIRHRYSAISANVCAQSTAEHGTPLMPVPRYSAAWNKPYGTDEKCSFKYRVSKYFSTLSNEQNAWSTHHNHFLHINPEFQTITQLNVFACSLGVQHNAQIDARPSADACKIFGVMRAQRFNQTKITAFLMIVNPFVEAFQRID